MKIKQSMLITLIVGLENFLIQYAKDNVGELELEEEELELEEEELELEEEELELEEEEEELVEFDRGLFSSLFDFNIRRYITPEIIELINSVSKVELRNTAVVSGKAEEYTLTCRRIGLRNVSFWMSETGLSALTIFNIVNAGQIIIEAKYTDAKQSDITIPAATKNFMRKLLCNFSFKEGSIEEFFAMQPNPVGAIKIVKKAQ